MHTRAFVIHQTRITTHASSYRSRVKCLRVCVNLENGLHAMLRGRAKMSVTPRGASQLRFLTLGASASIIVLALGMGIQPAHTASVSSACPSKSLGYHLIPRRRLAQNDSNTNCCNCFDPAYNQCVQGNDCAELLITGGRHASEDCYAACYDQAQRSCGMCLCNH